MTLTTPRPVFELMDPAAVSLYWPQIDEILDELPHTWEGYSKDFILNQALSGSMQVWGVGSKDCIESVIFTQVSNLPTYSSFQVFWMVGKDLDHLLPHIYETFTTYAMLKDCQKIEVIGRRGWEKKLRKFGFQFSRVVVSCDLERKRMN